MLARRIVLARGLGAAAAAGAATAGLAGCSVSGALNAVSAIESHRVAQALPYGDGPRRRFDLYQPARLGAQPPPPLVVFFYGGSWRSGDRGDYRFVGEALAARGIVTLVADYRLYPEVHYPGFVEDAADAVAFALANAQRFGADPQRVFVMGHSAGAYNAAMVALDPRWLARHGLQPSALAGWIGLAGPYNFLPIETPAVQPVFDHPYTPPDSQPIWHASRLATALRPALLGVAPADRLVDPQRNTGELAQALLAAGAVVAVKRYEHTGHATLVGSLAWPLRGIAPVLDDIVGFVHPPSG
jgi:acetyl esterase/lipase